MKKKPCRIQQRRPSKIWPGQDKLTTGYTHILDCSSTSLYLSSFHLLVPTQSFLFCTKIILALIVNVQLSHRERKVPMFPDKSGMYLELKFKNPGLALLGPYLYKSWLNHPHRGAGGASPAPHSAQLIFISEAMISAKKPGS